MHRLLGRGEPRYIDEAMNEPSYRLASLDQMADYRYAMRDPIVV